MATAPWQEIWKPQFESGEEILFDSGLDLLGRRSLVAFVITSGILIGLCVAVIFRDWPLWAPLASGILGALLGAGSWFLNRREKACYATQVILTDRHLRARRAKDGTEGAWPLARIRRLSFVMKTSPRSFFMILDDDTEIHLPYVANAGVLWDTISESQRDFDSISISDRLSSCNGKRIAFLLIFTGILLPIVALAVAAAGSLPFVLHLIPVTGSLSFYFELAVATTSLALTAFIAGSWASRVAIWLSRRKIPLDYARRYWTGDLQYSNDWLRRHILRDLALSLSITYPTSAIPDIVQTPAPRIFTPREA